MPPYVPSPPHPRGATDRSPGTSRHFRPRRPPHLPLAGLIAAVSTVASAQRPARAAAQRFMRSNADLPVGTSIGSRFVFNGVGCSGENVSPALEWRNASAGTRSFAVTVYDPDARTGSGR